MIDLTIVGNTAGGHACFPGIKAPENMQSPCFPGKHVNCFPRKQRGNTLILFCMFAPENGNMFDSLYFWEKYENHIKCFLDVIQRHILNFS